MEQRFSLIYTVSMSKQKVTIFPGMLPSILIFYITHHYLQFYTGV